MKQAHLLISCGFLVAALVGVAYALDPPHDATNTIDCSNCHTPHKAIGGTITTRAGNANLCQSCHTVGGLATSYPMDETDQATPSLGLPFQGQTWAITNADNDGSGLIRITASGHGFWTDDGATISGVTGTTEANGTWVITRIDANTFTLNNSVFVNPYVSGGTAAIAPTGTSHRWDSGASGHVKRFEANSSTGSVQSGGSLPGAPSTAGRYAKTYTITIVTGGDVGTATFNWSDTRGCSNDVSGTPVPVTTGVDVPLDDTYASDDPAEGCDNFPTEGIRATFTDGTSPSFVAGDQWRIYVRTDIDQPATGALAARIFDGKIACSTCHDQHSQSATPFDPSAPTTAGSAGRHYQRVDNDTNQMCRDCHSARDVTLSSNGSHPVGVTIPGTGLFKSPSTLPLDKTTGTVQCMSCHQPHYAPTNDGTLLRSTDVTSLCTDCHTLADTANGSHFNTTTGVLWPGGQYGSNFPAITDTSKRGACINCHQPHGWPDSATPSQDYAKLLVDKQENLCYTCHDGTVTTTANVYAQFNGATNFQVSPFNQRHDVSDADQAFSGGVVECTNCHNPHLANSTNKLINPDGWSDGTTTFVAGQPFTKTYSTANTYFYNSANRPYRDSAADNDPINPEGLPAGPSIGPAVEGVHNGDDLGTSNQGTGTYTGTEDLTYAVTISPGGTPGAGAGISVTTGSSTECPVSSPCTATVPAFGTFVNVGNFGVQIKFADGGSGGTPSSIGTPVCTNGGGGTCSGNVSSDDTATSSGTYMGPSNGTYTLTVTTAGCVSGSTRCSAGTPAVITCTSNISGDACNPSATYSWPQATPFAIGSYGVQVTITDSGTRDRDWELLLNQQWTIAVTAASGDGLLQSGDTWTIVASAGGVIFSEPDYVAFCLTCHDNSQPAGVTMPAGVTDIAGEYFSRDKMGAIAGRTGTNIGNGYLKQPWHVQPASCSAPGWTGCEDPSRPYAALNCTVCHDQHGSPNLLHLKSQITVGGVVMTVGGDNPSSQFGPGSFPRWGSATYTLPCQGGNGNPDCANNPGGVQQDFYYGAWCSFCHEMSSHPSKAETGSAGSCATSHSHGGGNF